MGYLDNDIELRINNQEIKILPTEFSFFLKDSIYDIFNTANFTFHDITGLFQESFLLTEGIDVDIKYGQEQDINDCKYTIIRDELDSPDKVGLMGGDVNIKLIHKWYDEQEIRSIAYSKKISTIINSIAQTYTHNFKELKIESTVNNDIWYQLLMTDSEFINEILLPNAYSYDSGGTPFYCYITNDNIFHLKNAKQMFDSNPIDTFTFEVDQTNEAKVTTIMDLKRWKKGIYLHHNLHHRQIFKINKDTGALESKDDYFFEHPLMGTKVLPFIIDKAIREKKDGRKITGYFNAGYTHSKPSEAENILGRINSSMRESMFLERFLITIPFYPKLKSGNSINMNIFMITEGKENARSNNYSSKEDKEGGEYVVEECTHVWDGKNNQSYTQLLIGRKYVDVPENYTLKEKLKQL